MSSRSSFHIYVCTMYEQWNYFLHWRPYAYITTHPTMYPVNPASVTQPIHSFMFWFWSTNWHHFNNDNWVFCIDGHDWVSHTHVNNRGSIHERQKLQRSLYWLYQEFSWRLLLWVAWSGVTPWTMGDREASVPRPGPSLASPVTSSWRQPGHQQSVSQPSTNI